jgi:hypothetical protein
LTLYGRPVKDELIQVFEQNNKISVTIGEATEILREHGHSRLYSSVRDNLLILTYSGFLIYDKNECRFSLSQNAMKADFTKKMPILPSKPKHRDHCDKCGRKFQLGEITYLHSFANIELYLCEECHEPKIVV